MPFMTYGHWHGAMAGGRSERKMEMKGSPKGLVSLTQLQVVLVDGQLQKQSPIFFLSSKAYLVGQLVQESQFTAVLSVLESKRTCLDGQNMRKVI